MQTLAKNDSNRNKLLVEELRAAGIDPVFSLDKNTIHGKLGMWSFRREENSWVAEVSFKIGRMRIPLESLTAFYIKRHKSITIIGARKVPSRKFRIYTINISTLESLTAFAHLIKAFAKE